MRVFADRAAAGRLLGARLAHLSAAGPVVLGLPRGGVPVAHEVAALLGAPLDVVVVRKLGVPGHAELAMGALGEGGIVVVNDDVVRAAGVSKSAFAAAAERERVELAARVARFRGGGPPFPVAGRPVILVDDGIATGATVRAACQVVRAARAARVVVAAPVAPPEAVADLSGVADEVVCVETPRWFGAVGRWYGDFTPVEDADVVALLAEWSRRPPHR